MANEIYVKDTKINVIQIGEQDYICITDMLKAKPDSTALRSALKNLPPGRMQ